MSQDLPAPDQIEGVAHPRETPHLFGQDGPQAEFLEAFNAGRMHSGWLLTGPRGVGKATLAYRIAAFLLSQRQSDGLLGGQGAADSLDVDPQAPDLRQIRAGAHPRLCVVTRGPNSTGSNLSEVITVERVRKIKDFFHMSAADGGHRVVIVDAADEMNRNAANALLKELEEPPARTTLLLLAHQPARLLPTIRSRCRVLRMQPLQAADMHRALEQAGLDDGPQQATLAALSAGSVGDAVRLIAQDGGALYGQMLALLAGAPGIDRVLVHAMADGMGGKAGAERFGLMLDLMGRMLARLARTGAMGASQPEALPGEAALFQRLCPGVAAARDWAALAPELLAQLRQAKAVNIDPGALTLEAWLRIDELAKRHA